MRGGDADHRKIAGDDLRHFVHRCVVAAEVDLHRRARLHACLRQKRLGAIRIEGERLQVRIVAEGQRALEAGDLGSPGRQGST